MASGAYILSSLVTREKIAESNNLELRLLFLNDEKSQKHKVQAGEISGLSSQMSAEVSKLRQSLSDNPSSEEYKQNMDAIESVENDYETRIQLIRDQMALAEENIDAEISTLNDRKEVVDKELEQWQKTTEQKAQNVK